jgi:hypothetical protein
MFKFDLYRLIQLVRKSTRHEQAQRNIHRAIMLSRLHRPTASPLPAEPTARRIEVQSGNLGNLMGFGRKIIVRRVTRVQIEVRHEN